MATSDPHSQLSSPLPTGMPVLQGLQSYALQAITEAIAGAKIDQPEDIADRFPANGTIPKVELAVDSGLMLAQQVALPSRTSSPPSLPFSTPTPLCYRLERRPSLVRWAASASAASLTEQTNGWRLPRSDDPSTDSRSIIATEGDGWMARGQDLEVAPEKCTGGRVWKECGSKCTRTCESPPIMPCVMLCVARCECPAGAPIWHNGASCILAEQC